MLISKLKPNKVSKSFSSYTTMIFGNPKVGKSTIAQRLMEEKDENGNTIPPLFLAFEQGQRAISNAMIVPIGRWEDLTRDKKEKDENGNVEKVPSINKQLKSDEVRDSYRVLIIDTCDIMYDMACQQICDNEGVEDILDIPFGKGLKMADDLFRKQLLEWENLNYKLLFISHSEDKKMIEKDHKGVEREISKFVPSLNKRAFKIVSKMVDNIFFAYLQTDENGVDKRCLFTRQTATYFSGSRIKHLPEVLPMDATEIRKAMKEAIEKEDMTTDEVYSSGSAMSTMIEQEFETFEEIKANVIDLVKTKFQPNGKMDIVSSLVTKHLGEGNTIGGATEDSIDGLDAILDELTAKSKELGL
ncbi:AAA family ATPase [Clostridium sp.]|uniref:AAA family ATPase n=1 Tax=Clostridium sp. TaxID=1506 RepID=UPI003F3B7E7A